MDDQKLEVQVFAKFNLVMPQGQKYGTSNSRTMVCQLSLITITSGILNQTDLYMMIHFQSFFFTSSWLVMKTTSVL